MQWKAKPSDASDWQMRPDERRETRKEAHTLLLCEVLIQAFRVPGTGYLQGGKQIVSALICQKLYQICIWIVTLYLHCGILCLSRALSSRQT